MTTSLDCPECQQTIELEHFPLHVRVHHGGVLWVSNEPTRLVVMQFARRRLYVHCWCGLTFMPAAWANHVEEAGGFENHLLRFALGLEQRSDVMR